MVRTASFILGVVLSATDAFAADRVFLEVAAGKQPRRQSLIAWTLPPELSAWELFSLRELRDGAEVPVAVQCSLDEPRELAWTLEGSLQAGSTRRYVLSSEADVRAPRRDPAGVECTNDGRSVLFRAGGRRVLAYNHAVVEPPADYDPVYARSGYIHPLWSPAGSIVTNDYPPNHKHHHGIWFPWTNTEFEGRHVDFWNSADRKGKVELVRLESFGRGPVFGWLRARHRHVDLTAPGGPKPALDETWELRVWAAGSAHVLDLVSTQTCAGPSPLLLKEYRYGGLGLRGSGDWEGQNVSFLTSEGRTRQDGHGTTARWCEVYGAVGGQAAGIAVLCHPANFRAPQNMRIHPSEPFFNFAPCQAGDFAIRPGEPYVSRYRFVVHDGEADAKETERWWLDYAEPPEVRVGDHP
jgi:hypothetical protein